MYEYLGMMFDFSNMGEYKISMFQYLAGVIKHAGEVYKQGAGGATPALSHLYDVRNPESSDVELLPTKEKEAYHLPTAQYLYLSKRARPDVQQSIAYHCTRVTRPDRDDQKKLARTIKYLIATIHLPLILTMNSNGVSEW